MKATWEGETLANSDDTIVVEGNHYFPADSIRREFFHETDHTTVCGWKGSASYYDIRVGEATNPTAAWYYPDPKPAAAEIRGRIAFWRGVEISDT